MTGAFEITTACTSADLQDVAQLFEQYAATLPVDLGYQDFGSELSTSLENTPRRPEGCSSPATRTRRRWVAWESAPLRALGAAR